MRTILSTIMEMALLEQPDNAKQQTIREVYGFYDNVVSDRVSAPPAKLQESLMVGNFPLYFARTLSVVIRDRFQYQEGQWRDYTLPDQLPDYRTGDRYRFSEFDLPVRRRDKQETRAGYVYEARTQVQLDDYAKQIDFSRRVLINDDMGAFNDIAMKMGDSTRRFLDIYVSSLYDNALSQAALIALGANYAGTGRLTTANLMIGWNAFTQRQGARGNPLSVFPTYLVIPPILKLTADMILASEKIAELATNGVNPLRNGLQVKIDPYIAFTVPNVPWYLFADPRSHAAVPVVRLTGRTEDFRLYAKAPDKTPMSASMGLGTPDWREGSFLTGDIEMSVETTIGSRVDDPTGLVGIEDPNGIYYSSGTTA